MRIGLMVTSTNKYNQFVEPLMGSTIEWFLGGHDLTVYNFSDQPHAGTVHLPVASWGFPQATLYRFAFMSSYAERLDADYLFACDADMLFVDAVGEEILPEEEHGGLTVVAHPGFWKGGGSWETNPASRAFTPPELRRRYVAGGFWGGTRETVLAVASELHEAIEADDANGIMAVWHDESHLNRYVSTRTPKILPPDYVYPQSWDLGPGVTRKLLALDKDHEAIRS